VKAIKPFHDFLKENVVKKQSKDRSRSEFLMDSSRKSFVFLQKVIEKVGVTDDDANDYVKDCYDILMELIRAKMLLEGYNAVGHGAHEAEVAYLRILNFTESDVQFANRMRHFRNGILYYGTQIDQEYAEKVIVFTKRVYSELKG